MAVPLKEVKAALRKSKGIVSVAAKNLGISDTALYRRIQRNKSLQNVKWEAREGVVDMAEAKLFKLINGDDFRAIKYTLSTLGKSRGYVERVESQDLTPQKKQVFIIGEQVIEF